MQTGLIQALIFFLTGGFLVFLAITITRDNFTNRVNRATGFLLLCAGLGPLALGLGYAIHDPAAVVPPGGSSPLYNLYHVWEFFFPALLAFSWMFPVDRLRRAKYPRLRYLIALPQALHVALVVLYTQILNFLSVLIDNSRTEGFVGLLLKPFAYLFSQMLALVAFVHSHEEVLFGTLNLAYVLIAVYFLEAGKRYLTNPRLLSQTRIVLWGMRLGLGFYVAGYLTDVIGETPTTDTLSAYLLIAAIVAGGGCLAYAIIRHQFLSVQLVFRQSLIYTFTSALLVGSYILVSVKSRALLQPVFGQRTEVVRYIFILFLLLLYQPISHWIDNIIRSMFVRTRTDHRNVIERFSRQVISLFDPAKLRQAIEETLKTSLLVDQVYFVLFDDSVNEYAILKSEDYPRRTVIDREDLMLRGINLLDTPTRYSALADYQEGSKLAEILNELNVRIILPMKDAEHLLGFLALTTRVAGYRYTAEDINLLGVLSNQMVSALTNSRLYADSLERMRLKEEVNMARQIQLDLLPARPPALPHTCISTYSTPSRTVGGDFYDFIELPDKHRLGIVIADASGKGMPAALMVAQIQAIIRSEVHNGNPIPVMLRNMNAQMVQSTSAEKFVTLFYAELDQRTGALTYANAGHNHPLLVRADGSVQLLDVGGPIIGAFLGIDYDSSTVQLSDEDVLFFFTDGLSEAMDAGGQEYGEDRIRDFVVAQRHETPEAILNGIVEDVRRFDPSDPPQDDTTIITLKMTNGSPNHGTKAQ